MNKKLIQLIKNKTDDTNIQFIRYIFVGGIAFLIDFSTLALLTEIFNIYYLISAAVAFIVGLIINYILSIVWVFKTRNIDNPQIEFLLFAIIGLFGLIFNEAIIWFASSTLDFHYLISKLIAVIIVFSWNFFARKLALFK